MFALHNLSTFLKRKQNPSYLVFLSLKKSEKCYRLSLRSNEAGEQNAREDVHIFLKLSHALVAHLHLEIPAISLSV